MYIDPNTTNTNDSGIHPDWENDTTAGAPTEAEGPE